MPPVVAAIGAAIASITVTQVVTGVLLSILTTALQMGLSALTRSKPQKPTISSRRQQLQSTVREPAAPAEILVGKTRKGGTFHFLESIDDETVLLMGVIVADHEVEAIDEIYNFDELMIDQKGVVQPKYKNLVQFEKFLGTADQQASQLLLDNFPGYTENDRLRGRAHVCFRFEFDRDVFDQTPQPRFNVRGAKFLDPRDGLTKHTSNAALVTAGFLAHPTYGLATAYGTDINNARLSASANECDEDVPIKAGKVLEFNGDDSIQFGNVLN